MNRYFTDEQKADLDFKTSVNKIGEIINFSQILNSLLWDNIAHGESVEENQDLYADISQLDVMSNLEIDKAKKIFEVDNAEELRILKAKYPLNDEEGLQIQPKFFMHVARKKGYYIEGKKNYKNHMTTMDYVQTIVDKALRESKKYSKLQKQPLSYVLDISKYDKGLVKYNQIERVLDIFSDMKARINGIYAMTSCDQPEKKILEDRVKYNAMMELSEVKLGYSTAYKLLTELDTNPEYRKMKNTIFYTMLSLPFTDFFKVFTESIDDISIIQKDKDNPDCYYYGVPYKHYKIANKDDILCH